MIKFESLHCPGASNEAYLAEMQTSILRCFELKKKKQNKNIIEKKIK
jgi:hypothetical protein